MYSQLNVLMFAHAISADTAIVIFCTVVLFLEGVVVLKRTVWYGYRSTVVALATKAVQCAALAFQCVDHVHGCDGLAFGMLGVGDCVTDNILQEYLEYTTSFFVYET